jgi:hypothetical protein
MKLNPFTLDGEERSLFNLALEQLFHPEFFFFFASGGLTKLRIWNSAAAYSEKTVRCALSLKLGDELSNGTLEWVKTIVYQEVSTTPEGLAKDCPIDAVGSTVKLQAAISAKPCLRGEECDNRGNLRVFGCSGDSPATYVLPYEEAQNLDCNKSLKTFHVIIPKYLASSDGSLHPKEIWASVEPFQFHPDSPEAQLRTVVRKTSNEATRIARLAHKSGNPRPQPFLSPRTLLTASFPVLVKNPVLGQDETNQNARFGVEPAGAGTRVRLIVFGSDAVAVDQAFAALWQKPNISGGPADFATGVDLYRCGKDGTALVGKSSNVVFDHQPYGVNDEIILGIAFTVN